MLRPWHYSLVLDKEAAASIHQQLIEHFRGMIEGGAWLGGSALPSSRDIAQRLSINRKTVSRVYEELSALGLIYTEPKRGTFVTATARVKQPASALRDAESVAASLQRPQSDPYANSIHTLIQKTSLHHIRRAALHMHKLQTHDYDATGLFNLKHMLANLLAHEKRFLVSPDHIACGSWLALQNAVIHSINPDDGLLLVDHNISASLITLLQKQGIHVIQLAETAGNQAATFAEQIEKYCINYPVAALWCDTSALFSSENYVTDQALLAQKLADYRLLLIDDQRSSFPLSQESPPPLASKYARSLMIGSLYGDFCDAFNLCYVASNENLSSAFLDALNTQHQQSSLLNMLAQSELIKRGEYKKLLTGIHRFLQSA
ncbi:GntR family transcriptional regulator [Methylophilus luteus]|uniref:GntR family transcriptional regulator n=1 Tax=Methylophilus luteus TaxID=640108 RepID=A0ABW3F5X2_9PROT